MKSLTTVEASARLSAALWQLSADMLRPLGMTAAIESCERNVGHYEQEADRYRRVALGEEQP